MHNVDASPLHFRWVLQDVVDTQTYDATAFSDRGGYSNYVPFPMDAVNTTKHLDADAGWAYAIWALAGWFSSYQDDSDVFLTTLYPSLTFAMEHWINITAANGGAFPLQEEYWGDWSQFPPGSNATLPAEYGNYYYALALRRTAEFAAALGNTADAARYSGLFANASAYYLAHYYDSSTGCFGACTYVSQMFALDLGLPEGSIDVGQVWARAMDWFGPGGSKNAYPGRFPGGILTHKLLYGGMAERFNISSLALQFLLSTDVPSLGFWINEGLTTLVEEYNMTLLNPGFYGVASYNHIMFGASGAWFYQTVAGLRRSPGSQSWRDLLLAPPGPASGITDSLSWASASVATPIGTVASSWTLGDSKSVLYQHDAAVPTNAVASIVLPTVNACSSVVVTEGGSGSPVFAGGQYVPGTPGLVSAECGVDGVSVVIGVGGGSYAFTVSTAA